MSTITKCDRCGEINSDEFFRIQLSFKDTHINSSILDKDLCVNCRQQLMEFLTNIK